MAKGLNQVFLMGNLTRDPELRTTPSGQPVASFALAINRSWTGSDGQSRDEVDYFDVVAWGKLGELVNQYLQKGRKCLVTGRLRTSTWEQDGQKRKRVEVVATDVTFLDGRSDGGGSGSYAPSGSGSSASSKKKEEDVVIEDIDDKPVDLSDIPF